MKKIQAYIIVVLAFLLSNAQAQSELDAYLVTGAENNPALKSAFADYNAALQKVPQIGVLPDPMITFSYFISPIETRVGPQRAKISLNQMFPWFGTLNAKEEVAVQAAKAKYEVFEQAKSELFFKLRSTYYNIYFNNKGIQITRENIAILLTFQQLAIIKIETGKSSVVDELRVEMEINELENQLAYLLDSKLAMEVKFSALLNVPVENPIIVPERLDNSDLTLSKDALLDSITKQNHFVKQLEYRIVSWQKQEVVAQKMGMPKISLGLDYAIIGESNNPNLGSENGTDAFLLPRVGISIPLYRKKYSAMVKEASFKMEAAEYRKEEKQIHLTYLFEETYKDYHDAHRRISLYKGQVELAEKSLNILLAAYSGNGENFEEVLRMERKNLGYKLKLEKAITDKKAAIAFIDYLLGK